MSISGRAAGPSPGVRKSIPIIQRCMHHVRRSEAAHLPLLVEAALPDLNLSDWGRQEKEFLDRSLLDHGAVLCRGFRVGGVDGFRAFMDATSREVIEYKFRASPRTAVGDRIYTSTDYPSEQSIFPHNEHSYSPVFPMKLYFYCRRPAEVGGETPVGDTRRIAQRLPEALVRRFAERGVRYVRNYGDGFGLPWQVAFQTELPSEVELYCQEHEISWRWKSEGRLQTWQNVPALLQHPTTGQDIWFNHATFFHATTLPKNIYEGICVEFDENDFPTQTYYGDGSPIEGHYLDLLRAAYLNEMVEFGWRQDDVLVLDNVLTVHGRRPFRGPREILVGMADPLRRDGPSPSDARRTAAGGVQP